jgi:Translation initiation factor 1A / IF-1
MPIYMKSTLYEPSFLSFSFNLFLVYAQVMRMLGSGRLEVYCFDGQTRLAIIRGNLRKKVSLQHACNPIQILP